MHHEWAQTYNKIFFYRCMIFQHKREQWLETCSICTTNNNARTRTIIFWQIISFQTSREFHSSKGERGNIAIGVEISTSKDLANLLFLDGKIRKLWQKFAYISSLISRSLHSLSFIGTKSGFSFVLTLLKIFRVEKSECSHSKLCKCLQSAYLCMNLFI